MNVTEKGTKKVLKITLVKCMRFLCFFRVYMGRFAPKKSTFTFGKKQQGKEGTKEKVKQTKCGSFKTIFLRVKFCIVKFICVYVVVFDILCYTFAIKSITIWK